MPTPSQRNRSQFSNFGIAQYLARALNELGYTVDIIHYENVSFVPDRTYDLFIGHGGNNFETIAQHLGRDIPKIYFATGIHWKIWKEHLIARQQECCQRRGSTVPITRMIEIPEDQAYELADGIICLGNRKAAASFCGYPLVIPINNSFFPDSFDISGKDFTAGRNRFLFFNGDGNILKGLDLLLEAFTGLDAHLYVRQTLEYEFEREYWKELHHLHNVHIIPYVPKPSPEFTRLMGYCNSVISTTCAEGQPGSIIECMSHGMIPILSREANIDTGEFGITINPCTIEEIHRTVNWVSQQPEEWHRTMSERVLDTVSRDYNEQQFLESMKDAITIIIEKTHGCTSLDEDFN
jgi:hypothetical protein